MKSGGKAAPKAPPKTITKVSKDKKAAPPKAKLATGNSSTKTKAKPATSKKSASSASGSKKSNPKPVGAKKKTSSSKVTPKKVSTAGF